jgi:hypothetical protein
MRTDANPMVYRWLVDTKEYDFTLKVILGKDNPVANNMPANIIAMLSPPAKIPENLQVLIMGLNVPLRMLITHSTIILVNPQTPSLRMHVKQYITMCPCCQKMSMLKIPIHSHSFTTSPWSV